MKTWLKAIALLGIGVLCTPAFGANPARPGTVNYIEGAAYLNQRQLNPKDVGSAAVDEGQVLMTGQGKAEILLTPGVYVRLDDQSALKMLSPDLTLTQVELLRGHAAVEVDEIHPQNDIRMIDGGVPTQLVKCGYYEFTAGHPAAMVFTGRAEVEEGDGKYTALKGHHELALAEGSPQKPQKFNAGEAEGPLYDWSSLRSQYLAEANNQIAGEYAGVAGFYPGWYWDPYMWGYTYIGMDPFWSPFGFGFYPPWYGFYGGGFYGRGFYGHGHVVSNGGFHGRGGFSGGGGFHGGGGGGRR